MKIMVIILIGLLLVSSKVYADLSVADLQKIREIVKESETRIKEIEKESETRMKEYVKESETRMKEYVSSEIEKVNIKITEMDKRLTIDIKAVDTQLGRNFTLILGLIALIVFAVGIPQIITALQGRELRKQAEKYEELKQEVEMLKQERIVLP